MCDAIPLVDMVSGIPPVGITQNERCFELWHCSSDAITSKGQRHISPLAAILENGRMTLFHLAGMGSGLPHVGITQNERYFELLKCSSMSEICEL
jgi:hypothetical protein